MFTVLLFYIVVRMDQRSNAISENDAKVVLCYNFISSIAASLQIFFSSHGFIVLFCNSLNEVITLGRSIPASLICIYVSGYDTSWIRLITSMNLDPLFYLSPLLIISQNVRMLLGYLLELLQIFHSATKAISFLFTLRSYIISRIISITSQT